MKINLIILTSAWAMCSLTAYAEDRATMLKGDITHGGFGGPEIRITQLDNESNVLVGGKGAWLVNHQFYLGGAGFGAVKEIGDQNMNLGYGGLLLGYIFPSQQTFTYSVELIAGAGSINEQHDEHMHSGNNSDNDTLMILEPAAYIQINLTEFANINAGISYRIVSDSDTAGLSNSNLSGLSANINVMFGAF